MKNKLILIIIILVITIFSKIFFKSTQFTRVIVFGDSYSDTGNTKALTTQITHLPKPPAEAYIKPSDELYWNGRYSNGKVAVEILGEALHIPLNNYSIGGATSGTFNYSSWLDTLGPTGLLGQVDKFKTELGDEPADPNALYFLFISANDFYYYMDYNQPGTLKQLADWSVSNILSAVRILSDLGARHFFIVNSSDLSLNPYEIMTKRIEPAQVFTAYFNAKLSISLNQLSPDTYDSMKIFDLAKFNQMLVRKANLYGLKEVSIPCQMTYPDIEAPHTNPEAYYFWDEWHYSARVNAIMGDYMYRQLINGA